MVALAAVLVLLLHFGWFVKGCVLPFVHRATPYRIEFSAWRCQVLNVVSMDNLVVRQIEPGGCATNVVAEARTLTVRYRLMSLFGSHPVIDAVSAIEPALGLAGATPEPSAHKPAGSAPDIARGTAPHLPPGIPSMPLPLSLGSLHIRNGHLAYTDASGMRVTVRALDLDASHMAPNSVAVLAASAILSLNDDHGVAITRLPVVLTGRFAFGDSAVPTDTHAELKVSNVIGRINSVVLTPMAVHLVLDARQTAPDVVQVERAEVRVDWLDAMLGRVVATGKFDVLHQCASCGVGLDVNPSPLWQALLETNSPIDIAHAGVDASLAFDIRGSEHVYGAAGSVAAKNISFADTVVSAPPDTDIAAVFTARYSDIEQAVDVSALALTATQRGAPVLSVRAESPVHVCWRDQHALTRSLNDHAAINLSLRNFQATQLNSLLDDYGVSIANGIISANATLDVAGQGRHMAVRGSCAVKDIDAAVGKARWRDIDCTAQVDTALDDFRMLSCAKNSVELSLDNEPAGQVAAGGYFDLEGGSNRLALVIAKLRSELLQRLVDPARKNKRLEGLDLTLQMVAKKPDMPRAPQDIELALTVDNRFHARQGDWQRLSLDTRASLLPTVTRLDKFTVTLAPGEWTDNSLDASGAIYLVPTNLASRLTLFSRHFDASILLDTFMPLPTGKQAADSTKGASPDTPADAPPVAHVEKEPPPPSFLRGRDVSLDVRIAELRARDTRIMPLDFDARISNKVLNVVSRDIRPNGGVLDVGFTVNLGVTGFVYAATLATTNMPLKPLINTWVVSRHDKIDGLLASKFTCNGRGVTLPSLKKYFSADLDAWLLDGYLYNAVILDDVGKALHIKALREFEFGEGRVDMIATNGIVTVYSFALQGSLAKMNMRGTVDFDQRISLDMMLELNSQLLAGIVGGKAPSSVNRGTYVAVPVPIPIRGTLKDRTVDVSYADILPQMLKALGTQPVQLIKSMINSIPENKATKSIGDGLKLIQGMIEPKKSSRD